LTFRQRLSNKRHRQEGGEEKKEFAHRESGNWMMMMFLMIDVVKSGD
jgi:heme/copper-type cytochrome/quinol oxidase subunit 3